MITTVCIFSNSEDAESALCALHEISIPKEEISYIYTKIERNSNDSMSIGDLYGYITVKGQFKDVVSVYASGFFGEKLSSIKDSVSAGFINVCEHFGISEKDAKRFYEYVKGGDILIFVCIQTPDSKGIFTRTHAREIQEYTK